MSRNLSRAPIRTLGGLALSFLVLPAGYARAQQPAGAPTDIPFGPRFSLPEGARPEIWNPAKSKLMAGGPLIGGTVRATDARTYCAMAGAGYDFLWVEMQHEAISWEQVARMWRTCPGPAAPGVRVAEADEREIQHATDSGTLVVIVPTVDSVEEARDAIDWTYFPPLGRRSSGGGQGPSEMWNGVPGGYRQTWNDNVVLILMIETLEGVRNAREIARLPGVTALFAASGDLGNFSGYREGDAEYEALVTEVVAAAREAGVHVCGPLRWANRPSFTCFQAGTEEAVIRRGAEAEIQQATALFEQSGGGRSEPGASSFLADLTAHCTTITYEADCYASVRRAAEAAEGLPSGARARIVERLLAIEARNPNQAARVREVAEEEGLHLPTSSSQGDRDRP